MANNIQSISLNPTPVNPSTQLSLSGHQVVTALSLPGYNFVDELSEVDCKSGELHNATLVLVITD